VKKIAHLTSVHARHDTRIFLKQCQFLANSGYEVYLVVADGMGDEEREGVQVLDVGKPRGRLGRMLGTTRRVLARAQEVDADIYHLHDPELVPVGRSLKRRGKTVVYDAHEDLPRQILDKPYLPAPLRRAVSTLAGTYLYRVSRHLDGVIAATPAIRRAFEIRGVRAVAVCNYPLSGEMRLVTAKAGSEQVCYVGALTKSRGIVELVNAIGHVKSGATLALAGRFLEDGLRDTVAALPEWNHVEELGFLDRSGVSNVLASSRAGLVTLHPTPAYVDSLPVKMFEYMSAGIPVIASDFPLWREIIEDAGCGLLVDPLDPSSIAAAVEWILEHPEQAEIMGRNGRDAVMSKYNWEEEGSKLLALYEGLGRKDRPVTVRTRTRSSAVHLTSVHTRHDTRIFFKQCRSLAKAGHDVVLIVADGRGDEEKDGIRILDVGRPNGRLDRMFRATRRVQKLASTLDADVYHLHDPELLFAGLALKRGGRRVVFDSHEDVPRQILSKSYLHPIVRRPISAVVAAFERFACRRLDAVMTATPAIRDKFSAIGIGAVDVNNFSIQGELVSTEVPKGQKEKAVCYVGGIAATRGIRQLIAAMDLTRSGARLNLGGEFTEASFKRELQAKSGWRKVNELGFLSRGQVKDVLNRSIAGVVTFLPEPNHVHSQPNKMFEYMSAGLPVIASNFPLWREIVEGNECGICVDPADPAAIAAVIDRLVENPALARRLGENGRRAVAEHYNWAVEERKLLELYDDLLVRG
jgi:glycosyltransferase involved in cell wall biosynthesis